MDRQAFTLLHETEQRWWYKGRAHVVARALSRCIRKSGAPALDFGAGFGGMYALLTKVNSKVYAFEPDREAREVAQARGYAQVFSREEDALGREYGMVALFDVLEHLPDDAMFLSRLRGTLEQDGVIVLTVPAMPFLWSKHDVMHHHQRRYTSASLRRVLEAQGFQLIYMRYWNTFLFPVAAIARLLNKTGESSLTTPAWIDRVLYMLIVFETAFMRYIPLPFGISLVAVARKR